jgi:hypothetical protein
MMLIKFLLSLFGVAYLIYGRKQQAILATVCGVGLMLLGYFAPNPLVGIGAGLVLVVAPLLLR